ncbi:Steroid 5-alpha reductase family enzyme [Roseateles sp. YR242]|uniref:DUF1295 domain-containing protein n=1 Tax=Roseateles sp. YR242 TaxID=1855305 RepID=UPI0008AB4B7B|nr:DUF1295 domain-containing protein [Roseateles sp. YR242]SEK58319.1 Steroid 5-alpha reductase family enzyme [Roseateles sp. YR242]
MVDVHEFPSQLTLGLSGLLLAVLVALPTWAVSVRMKDASLADRVWSVFIAAPALLYGALAGADARLLVMLAIAVLWALRLGLYITIRNWGHGEDRRYQAMRARNQPGFALKSLWLVFLLQAVLGWVVSAPLLAAAHEDRSAWGLLDSLGAVVAASGLLVEAIADAQMARFRRQASRQGRVMDTGLWRYSRHPNYFGECCLWWGLGMMAVSAGEWGAAWSLASPLLMTFLLLRVSGVTLLEKDMEERHPAYRDYIARTSVFIPWPPKAIGPSPGRGQP